MEAHLITTGTDGTTLEVSLAGASERRLHDLSGLLGVPLSAAASLALRHGLQHPRITALHERRGRPQKAGVPALELVP